MWADIAVDSPRTGAIVCDMPVGIQTLRPLNLTNFLFESSAATEEPRKSKPASPREAIRVFEELDNRRADSQRHVHLLDEFSRTSQYQQRGQLAQKIRRLLTAYQEESGGAAFSFESLSAFLALIQTETNLRLPAVAVTTEGNIYCSWRNGPSQLLSLQFFPNKEVAFVVFRPDDHVPGAIVRRSGLAFSSSIPAEVGINNLAWVRA